MGLPEKCQKCNTAVEWVGLSTLADNAASIAADHYYYDYAEDSHAWTRYKEVTGTVCVYISEGKTLTGPSRVFTVTSGALTLMGDGSVVGIGYTGSYDGGAIKLGGGTLNVLGGRVALELAQGKQVRNGDAVYLSGGSTLSIDGGSIVGGTTTAAAGGHVILVIDKKVVYNPDGSIDGARSYIHTLEQTPGPVSRGVETCSWNEELGEVVYTIYKEAYMPFDQVFSSGYLPMTCQALIDASPVEAAKVTDSVDAADYNYENLLTGEFTTNRMVSSVTLTVTDENGEVFHVTGSGIRATIKSYDLQNFLTENYEGHMVLRGALELEKLVVGETYHCTVVVSLGSGEKITVRDFDFVATDADISTPSTPSVPGTGGDEEEEGDITEEPTDPAA